ncbi:P2X purinoceptor 7-like [Asterias amurensis]|uniref:P2X purinoceptor 7-like n=1 Tax=Asterias amurensis TaxID=7602 RepID=UPI003AB3E7C4
MDREENTDASKKKKRKSRQSGSVLKKSRRGHVGDSGDQQSRSREQKIEEIKKMVEDLGEKGRKDLLRSLCERMPGLVLNILETSSNPAPPHHPPAAQLSPSWCVCTHCREMPTQQEKLCCQQRPNRCISNLAIMRHLVLDNHLLELARLHRNDLLGQNDLPPGEHDIYNRRLRHSAYRQYVLWQHGRLGAGNRVTIPSCCVWKIRDSFPDSFGAYTGFIPNRFN